MMIGSRKAENGRYKIYNYLQKICVGVNQCLGSGTAVTGPNQLCGNCGDTVLYPALTSPPLSTATPASALVVVGPAGELTHAQVLPTLGLMRD